MKTELVKFHETELVVFVDENNNTPMVAIKPICDAIGLHADSAVKSIKNHPILGDWHAVHHVSVGENKKINHVLLPIEYVSGWLFSINSNKCKPEVQQNLITYQRECFKVLYDHFFGKQKTLSTNLNRKFEISKRLKEIDTSMNELTTEMKMLKKENANLQKNEFKMFSLFTEEELKETNKLN